MAKIISQRGGIDDKEELVSGFGNASYESVLIDGAS